MRRNPPPIILGGLSGALACGYGVLFTVVGDYRDEYGISETEIGILIGAGFLAAFFSQIFVAPIADRGHARTIIIVGVIANFVGLMMMAFGTSLTPLLLGRVISGVGIGSASPAIRRIVILSDPENLGRNLGRLLSAGVFGFALGPAISAVLVGPFGLASPFIVVATANVVLLPLASAVTVTEKIDESRRRLAFDLLRSRVVAGALVLGATIYLMIGTFDALWDVVHEDLGTSDWMANLGITLFAAPLVIFGPFGGRLAQRIGPFRIGAAGLSIGAVFIFMYGQLPSGEWIFTVGMIHACSDGLTMIAPGVAVAMSVPEERQAGAQGLMGAGQALTAGITAIVVGYLYETSGRAAAYATAAGAMAFMIIIAVALAAPFIWGDQRPKPTASSSSDDSTRPSVQS